MKASELVAQIEAIIESEGDLNLVDPMKVGKVFYRGHIEEHRIHIEELEESDTLNGREYTGYSDKKGVDIYLGDKVKNVDCVGTVKSDDGEYYVEYELPVGEDPVEDYYDSLEVIGR